MHQVITREMRRQLERENDRWPVSFKSLPRENWPSFPGIPPLNVFRSREFLAQVFDEGNGTLRISVNRTRMQANGRWEEGISWDELQGIKRQLGYGDRYAVEVFPRDADVVNVANMRHLWLLAAPLEIGWFK